MLFLILAPFATFAMLTMLTTVKISLASSAAVAFGLVSRDFAKGRSIKMLSTGALVLFAALAGYHFLATTELSLTTVRLAIDSGVLAIALGSMAIRLPFTIQYAREVVDDETTRLPRFVKTNYILTWVWTAAFALMLVADIVAIYLPSTPLWACAAIAFAARNSASYFTQWYPKHVRAAIAAGRDTAPVATAS
ncbi:hypothetical protein V1281_003003 [Nitrobacteraceae bacterium AZCC 2161]